MSMFGFGKKEVVPVQEMVVEPAPKVNSISLHEKGMRKNMWVMTEYGVGIITGCNEFGVMVVALVKPDGNNVMEIDENDKAVTKVVYLDNARAATIDEIPVTRRGGVV